MLNRHLEAILNNKLDICFFDIGPKDINPLLKKFNYSSIYQESLVLCASHTFFNKHIKGKLNYKTISILPHITYHEDDKGLIAWYNHHFKRHPHNINKSIAIENVSGVINAIKHNLGLGLVPRHAIIQELHQEDLIEIAIKKNDLINSISIATLKDRELTSTELSFIDFLKNKSK